MGKSNIQAPDGTTAPADPTIQALVDDLKSKQDALDKITPDYQAAVRAHSLAVTALNAALGKAGVRSRVTEQRQGVLQPMNSPAARALAAARAPR